MFRWMIVAFCLLLAGCAARPLEREYEQAVRDGDHERAAALLPRIADARQSDSEWWDLGEALTGAAAVFVPGLAALPVISNRVRRHIQNREKVTAETVVQHIDDLRAVVPELDKAFEDMTPEQKLAVRDLLAKVPPVVDRAVKNRKG